MGTRAGLGWEEKTRAPEIDSGTPQRTETPKMWCSSPSVVQDLPRV